MKGAKQNAASTGWNAPRIEQLRRWRALPLREKLQAVEDMGKLATHFAESRRKRGLPYFDPINRKLIPGG